MKSGIYQIYCTKNNKYYIGQSINMQNRLNQHLSELRNNTHQNKALQSDFNKFKEKAFVFKELKCIEEQFLNIMEGYFIDLYDSIKNGYNVQDVIKRVREKERIKMETKKQIEYFKNLDSIDISINKRELTLISLYDVGFFFEQYYGYDIYSEDEESLIEGSKFGDELFGNLFELKREAINFSEEIKSSILSQIKEKFPLVNISELHIDYPNEEGSAFESELKNIMNLVSKNELYCICDYEDESGQLITRHLKLKISDSKSTINL